MNPHIRVLIADDNPADAELIVRELRRAGYAPEWERVDSEAAYVERLCPGTDIILSDFEMPQFGGRRALELLRESGLVVPFIIISGTIGEDIAVQMMRQGATDYLLKDRLTRLGPAVNRALEDSRLGQERRRAVADLELFRALVDQSNDTIEIVDPETARFLDVNANGPAELGCSREEYLSLRVFDIDPTLDPSTWQQYAEGLRMTGHVKMESRHRRKDGTTFPVEISAKWVRLDRDYIIAGVSNITERKRNEARFRRLVDSNAQGVIFCNSKGRITGANEAFLNLTGYGLSDLEAEDFNWKTMTPPEYAAVDRKAVDEMATRGACTPYEKEYIRRNGSRVPVLVGAATFEDNPEEGVSFAVDLTERKNLEQQFYRSQRMESIGTLAGGIAHDLNNVLAPIMMSIDLLRSYMDRPDGLEILDLMGRSARRGAEMVGQVLAFARGIEGSSADVLISPVVGDLVKIIGETFPKNIRIETEIESGAWSVRGDSTQLHQVLLNLCVNSRDAMPEGGRLILKVGNMMIDDRFAAGNSDSKPGPHLMIEIEDTGPGIPSGIVDKLFDPFFTTKEVGKGTGLGLSTSLAIIKGHGGFIQVCGDPGKGARFRIYLPAASDPVPAASDVPMTDLPRGNGETVMVVDDEASIRQITKQTLEAFGYHVMLASDGSEAVSLYLKHRDQIAVVITDMMMPVLDGSGAIQLLRRLNPAVRVIAVSGIAADAHREETANDGDGHFLLKPYTAETLLRAIRGILTGAVQQTTPVPP